METYSKIFNIRDATNHGINPNIRVFVDNSWVQNDTYGKYYGAPISDVIPPTLNQLYNPYKESKRLSYKDILIIYKKLSKYQKFVKNLCLKCKTPTNTIIADYIDLVDDYIIYDGNILFNFTYYLVSQNINFNTNQVNPIQYYPTNSTISFMDKVTNKYGGLLTILWQGQPIDYNDQRVDLFIKEYINNKGKIGKLIDIVYEYKLSLIDVNSSSCDIASILFNEISTDIFNMANEFYQTNVNCKTQQTQNPGNVATNSATCKIDILLSNNFEDLGIFFVPAQTWVCGRVYKPGDTITLNGVVYTPNSTFSGWYNAKANKIYFDETYLDSNGFPTGELKMNGVNFTNMKRTTMNTATAVTIQARIDSQLAGLRAYRSGTTNWFDTEGRYKVGIRFHEEDISGNGSVKYESFIKSIQQRSPEVGHDVIVYTYVIDQLNSNPFPDTGIQFVDEYHRYKIGNNDFYYDFGQKSYITYQAKTLGNYSTVYKGSNGIFPYGDTDRFDYFPLSKREYYNGLAMEPVISRDVNIDRQINRAYDRHMALAECKTFQQLLRFRNGGFYTIKDLTQTNNENEITQRS